MSEELLRNEEESRADLEGIIKTLFTEIDRRIDAAVKKLEGQFLNDIEDVRSKCIDLRADVDEITRQAAEDVEKASECLSGK